jgi:hypothetical protein
MRALNDVLTLAGRNVCQKEEGELKKKSQFSELNEALS